MSPKNLRGEGRYDPGTLTPAAPLGVPRWDRVMEGGRGLRATQGSGCAVWNGFWSNSPGKPRPPPSACGSPGRGGKGKGQIRATPWHCDIQPGPPVPLQPPVPGSEGCSARQHSQPAAPSRPGTAPSPLSSLPGACGAARRRCGCQQRAEPAGRKDSSSPRAQPCASPLPHIPLLCAGNSLSLFWLSHGL